MTIGLVGEAPNDTNAIKNLLSKQYSIPNYYFYPILDHIHGSQLDNPKTKRLLRIEYEFKKPDIVIFIRDLDGTLNNNLTFESRKQYFTTFNKVIDKKGLFLLNIFEIEALIISDIEAFNVYFNCQLEYDVDPMNIENPKEDLKRNCPKYNESLNPAIFSQLAFQTVKHNCTYFNNFKNKFEKRLINFT